MVNRGDWHLAQIYKSLLSSSAAGFKYLAVLNGGTWLSALAFSDRLADSDAAYAAASSGIGWIIWSLGLTGVYYLFSYLTQMSLYNEECNKQSGQKNRFRIVSRRFFLWGVVIFFIVAIGCYVYGAIDIKFAFFDSVLVDSHVGYDNPFI